MLPVRARIFGRVCDFAFWVALPVIAQIRALQYFKKFPSKRRVGVDPRVKMRFRA